MKPFFISTSIPYVNARPHLGHAQEFVLADVIARYRRLMGGDVFFLSGTDDNALKNVQAAETAGARVTEWVSENAGHFKKLARALSISNDDFIQTASDPRHAPGAQKLWNAIKKDDIYKKKYKGLYCVGCEEFKTEKDLKNKECEEHPGKKPEEVEEENYFFKLSAYEKELKKVIESGVFSVLPESRRNETLRFIEAGLHDFSISRSQERAKNWGVPVPGDSTQIMYVWVDALSNYINALGYAEDSPRFKKYWSGETMHVIGKGINRFHTIYWPAMLLSAGLKLPDTVFVHGYITIGGKKMSKSLGNAIDPMDIAARYGADALRYFLIREVPTFEDGDFTEEHFLETYNANLANGLGNLTARIMKLAEDYLSEGTRPESRGFPDEYSKALAGSEIHAASDFVWSEIQKLDQKITETQPFKLIKKDVEAGKKLIFELTQELYSIARMLCPFMPGTSDKIKQAILDNKKPDVLFPRK